MNRITNVLHARECRPPRALIAPGLSLAAVLIAVPLGVGHSPEASISFGLLLTIMAVSGAVLWSWMVRAPIGILEGLGAGLFVSIGVTSLAVPLAMSLDIPPSITILLAPLGAACVLRLRRSTSDGTVTDSFEPGHLVCLFALSVVALTPFVTMLLPGAAMLVVWVVGSRAWSTRPRFRQSAHAAAIVVSLLANRLASEALGLPPLWLATADQDIVIDEAVGAGLTTSGLHSTIGLLDDRVRGNFGLSLWQAAVHDLPGNEGFLFAGIAGSIMFTFCFVLLVHATTVALGGTFRVGLLAACIAAVTALPGYTPLFVFHNFRGTNFFSLTVLAFGLLLLVRHLAVRTNASSVALVLVAMLALLAKVHVGAMFVGIVTLSLVVRSIRLRTPALLPTIVAICLGSGFVWIRFIDGALAGTAFDMVGGGFARWGAEDRETIVAIATLGLKGCAIALLTRATLRTENFSFALLVPSSLFVWWLLGGASSSDYLIHYSFAAVAPLLANAATTRSKPLPRVSRWPFVVAGIGGFGIALAHQFLSGSARYRPSEEAFSRLSYWRPEALALVLVAVAVVLGFALHRRTPHADTSVGALLVIGASFALGVGAFVGHGTKPVVHGVLFDRWDVNQPILNDHQLAVGAWLSANTDDGDVIATNELCAAELRAGDSTVGIEACSGTSTSLWWISGLSGRQVLIEGPEFGPLAFGATYSARQAEYHNASRGFAVGPTLESANRLRTLGVRWFVRNSSHASDGPLDERIRASFTSGPYSVIDLTNVGP